MQRRGARRGRKVWGEDNKKVKWQDIVQAKQVPLEKKKKKEKLPNQRQIEREYERGQIKCQSMQVRRAESDYEQPIMKDIKTNN